MRSHYQNTNSVSTYLWSRFPDKYYIYKYSECKEVAATLESDYAVSKRAKADDLIGFFRFYDEIADYLKKDKTIKKLITAALTPECYPDPQFRTLTIDVGFYISRYYNNRPQDNPTVTPPDPPNLYWPSQDEYPVNITKDEWKKFIEEIERPSHTGGMAMLKALLDLGGEASCKKLSTVYGGSPSRYVGLALNISKRAKAYFNMPPCLVGNVESFFPIPFLGRSVFEDGTKYYSYKLRDELALALKEIDLSDIDPYVRESRKDDSGYWWLNANPKVWSFADMEIGSEQSYTLYNENGNKRRIFQNFLDAKAGDMVIGYEATPVKQIVAIARISKEQNGKELFFEKTEGLSVPIDYQTLRECPALEEMEYFAQPQGSLFRLTRDEYEAIMEIIREANPVPIQQETLAPYTKEDFLDEVFMTETEYDSLVSLLKNKKNLILQGAPGVGKTFAAKRLAYSMMGEIEKKFRKLRRNHRGSNGRSTTVLPRSFLPCRAISC